MRYRFFKRVLFVYFLLSALFSFSPSIFAAEEDETEETEKAPIVTNSFFETDIREVLRDISAQTSVKIVPDETVQGSISIELKQIPLEEALRMVLAVGNYSFLKMPGGYYLVGLCTPSSPSYNKLSVTDYFHPNYLTAKEIQSLTSDFYWPYIKINEDVNSLTISGSPEIVKRIKEDFVKIDRPPRQVMIEAMVIELSEEGKKELGVTWGSMLEGGFSVYSGTANSTSGLSTIEYAKSLGKINLSTRLSSSDLFMRINTLVSEGKAKIRANPRVATLDGKQAQISIGKEEYYLINVGTGSTNYYTLQSVSSGVILKITPRIAENKQITVLFTPEVSEVVGRGATNLPVITKRGASTTLRVADGQTFAIGGLIQEQSSEETSKVPGLGSLPFVGGLFRHKKTTSANKEVIIFFTPHILGEKGDYSGMDSQARQEDPIKRYYLEVHSIIEKNKKVPDLDTLRQGGPRAATVRFTIFSNGTVGEVSLVTSSGIPILDRISIELIENISPFPPFPEEIKQLSVTFVAPIKYEF